MLIDRLSAFCNKIGFTLEQIMEAESRDILYVSEDIPAYHLKAVTIEDINTLCDTFGESLSLTIGETIAPLVDIVNGDVCSLNVETISRRKDETLLSFRLSVNKKKIISKLIDQQDTTCAYFYYFFIENLALLFLSPISLDTNLFITPYTPTIVVVSNHNLCILGMLLKIIGEKTLEEHGVKIVPLNEVVTNQISRFHEIASENLSWNNFQLKNITPVHFFCSSNFNEPLEIIDKISRNLLISLIIYTANRSSFHDNVFECTYSSSEQVISLKIDQSISWEGNNKVLYQAALWPYQGKDTDRLVFFQNVVARKVDENESSTGVDAFKRHISSILSDARWHYRIFIDGQITKHFDQIENMVRFVSGVSKEIGESIDAVTKSIVEALLAAIGVIVLSILTTLVDNKINQEMFILAVRAYAVYLLVFQVGFRMGSIFHSHILTIKDSNEQVAFFNSQLGKAKVELLIKPITRRKLQFIYWFLISSIIGIIISIGLFLFPQQLQASIMSSNSPPVQLLTQTITPGNLTQIITPTPFFSGTSQTLPTPALIQTPLPNH